MTRINHPESRYEHFTSIILYPEGNDHFRHLVSVYKSFFNPGYENSFLGITYEEFIKAARELTNDTEYLRWLQYLECLFFTEFFQFWDKSGETAIKK